MSRAEAIRSLWTAPGTAIGRGLATGAGAGKAGGGPADAGARGTAGAGGASGSAHRRPPPRSQAGSVYLLLLAFILILGVTTATAAPMWRTIAQRDREEELLFRLGEFRRAINRFRAEHNRFPRDLKELLDDRTTLQPRRYLRRIYTDPMTGKADWKVELVADRTGVVSGIKDVHSASEKIPLKKLRGKKDCYCDW